MKRIDLHSDRDLVMKLKANDQFAFEILFYRYKNKVKGFVSQIAPSQIDPDEIVQKVFIKIWLQKDKIDPKKNFSSFLFVITRNEIVDQIRSSVYKKIYFMGDELLLDLEIEDVTGQDAQKDMEQQIELLLRKMPERRRQIFELSRFEGLSYKKIAENLHITENTVDTQIRNALNFLRNEIRKIRFSIFLFFQTK
ncbi:MAG: RNA polymerase sigma-70 factor [Prolixibacteraceae bacterium]